jgi:hypothetical protein
MSGVFIDVEPGVALGTDCGDVNDTDKFFLERCVLTVKLGRLVSAA